MTLKFLILLFCLTFMTLRAQTQRESEKIKLEWEKINEEKAEINKEKAEIQKEKEELRKQKEEQNKAPNEEASEEDFFKLEENISIVSKRVGQTEKANRASAIVSVINRNKIEDSGARNLADILKQVPGVEIFMTSSATMKYPFGGFGLALAC